MLKVLLPELIEKGDVINILIDEEETEKWIERIKKLVNEILE
jgi:hypothetical protein